MTLMYREKELLELLIECVEESTQQVSFTVGMYEYCFTNIQPKKLVKALKERLERGNMPTIVGKDEQAYKRITCGKCASILEYTLAEVVQDCAMDYTGGKDYYKYVMCPCCGNKVNVKGC